MVGPRYQAILDALAQDISSGELSTGTRLPAQRDLAKSLGLALGTVTRAYKMAEELGLVRAEMGRGTFVLETDPAQPASPLTPAPSTHIDLAANWPLQSLDPELGEVLSKLAKSDKLSDLTQYQERSGLNRHRESGVAWLKLHGLRTKADRVLICSGAHHAITVILSSLASRGEALLCEELSYPGLRSIAQMLGIRLIGLPSDEQGIRPEALETAVAEGKASALYCNPTLHNPSTTTWSLPRRLAIAEIARDHSLPIIEDATYRALAYRPGPTLASLSPDNTYFIASTSKCIAGGLRLAFLAAPETAIAKLEQHIWASCWMTSPLSCEIFKTWLDDGTAIRTLDRKKAEAQARVKLVRRILPKELLHCPSNSYHAWVKLPSPWSQSGPFVALLQEHGISVLGADVFFVGEGLAPTAIRISLSSPETRDELERGLQRIAQCLRTTPPLPKFVM